MTYSLCFLQVLCMWFHSPEDCAKVANLLQRMTSGDLVSLVALAAHHNVVESQHVHPTTCKLQPKARCQCQLLSMQATHV